MIVRNYWMYALKKKIIFNLLFLFLCASLASMEKESRAKGQNPVYNPDSLKELCVKSIPRFSRSSGEIILGVLQLPEDLKQQIRAFICAAQPKKRKTGKNFIEWLAHKGITLDSLELDRLCLLGAIYNVVGTKSGKKIRITNHELAHFYSKLPKEFRKKLRVHINQKLLTQYGEMALLKKLKEIKKQGDEEADNKHKNIE